MRNYLRENKEQAFTIEDKAAVNAEGGVALWDMPPIYSTAYNPIIFKRTRYLFALDGEVVDSDDIITSSQSSAVLYRAIEPDTAAIIIRDVDEDRTTAISAETFNGEALYDVSAVVRLWFNEMLADTTQMPVIDRALFVRFTIEGLNIEGWAQVYMALNAVAQVGESSDMLAYHEKLLTRAPHLYLYGDYPGDFARLTSEGVVRDTTSSNMVLLLDAEGTPILTEAGEEIYIITGAEMEVVTKCVPPQPFYVRWINQLGGVDYWMFRQMQEYAPSVKNTSEYDLYIANPIDARTNRRAYAIDTENTVTVGQENIPSDFFECLRWLPFSPYIEWYNEKIGKWIAVTVDKYDGGFLTKHTLHGMEITFNLPKINTQF